MKVAKYNEYLYDDIGNTYERKNVYLKELVRMQDKIDLEKDPTTKKKLEDEQKQFIKNKANHPYQKRLADFKTAEKAFRKTLSEEKKTFKDRLKNVSDPKLKKLKVDLFVAQKEVVFYKKYTELSYDAVLHYKNAELITLQMGEIIKHLETNLAELTTAKEKLKQVSSEDNAKAKEKVSTIKKAAKEQCEARLKELKTKQNEGLISAKAYDNGKKQLKAELDTKLELESYTIPKKGLKELIKSKTYEVKKVTKQKLIILQDNQSNIRRITPEETEQQVPFYSYVGCLIPGLGQLLNKQYMKMLLFLIGTLFIYFVAIPYALGYGNYQGNGIEGLVNLAAGGPKLHKSLMYMIEGIIALCLIIFAAAIYILNFIDVYKVQKNAQKGIRPKNWFESKRTILEEGFPYLVSLPTLVVLVFIVIVPMATAVLLSFTNMDPKNQSKFSWVGFSNYMTIIKGEGMAGSVFWHIFGWTLVWTAVATTLAILLGFFLALLANNERIRGKAFFRTVFLLPWAVPAFITIMFFSIMLSREGILTQVINNLTGLSLDVKNDPFLTRVTLIMIQGWLGSSYVFLLSTGVLQAIPGDLYEAAQIDGATAWQKLKKITLPMVLFQTAPLLVGQYTFNFNNFSIIYLFNGGGPFNPKVYGNLAGSSDILISYIYKLTMDNQQQAVGAAITIVISLGLMFFAYLGFKNSKAFKEERL